jgi:hypothetical protein
LAHLDEQAPTSFAERFPTIPKPEDHFSPKLMAAQWVCCVIFPEDLPSLTADLLESGQDSPARGRDINSQQK